MAEFEKKFELLLETPDSWEVTGSMADNWEKHLGDAGGDIKDKLEEKFPDDGTWKRDVVDRSSREYAGFVNPGYITKGGRSSENIRSTRDSKLVKAFVAWKEGITKAFATVDGIVAKFFRDRVTAAKDRWAVKMAEGALRFTGDKIRGRSVVPITASFLVGEGRATSWLGAGHSADGDPYDIARTAEEAALKPAIVQRLVQGGIMVTNSGNSPTEILRQNTINASVLNGFRDTAKCDAFVPTPAADKCFCSWEINVEGRLVLHTQVGLTV